MGQTTKYHNIHCDVRRYGKQFLLCVCKHNKNGRKKEAFLWDRTQMSAKDKIQHEHLANVQYFSYIEQT